MPNRISKSKFEQNKIIISIKSPLIGYLCGPEAAEQFW